MCGIYGFIGKKDKQANSNALKLLCLYNVSRGYDSTGILTLKDNDFFMHKDIISGFQYNVNNPEIHDDRNIFIGHTRAKTVGQNTIANAHPFIGEHISGVHNGTLLNHEYMYDKFAEKNTDIPKRNSLGKDISDSRLLYKLFNNEDFKEVLEVYEGAIAMMAIKKDGTLHVYHDDGRPLHVGEREEGLYFSSEGHPLQSIGCKNIKELDKYQLYTYKDGELLSFQKITRSPWKKPEPAKKSPASSETSKQYNTTVQDALILEEEISVTLKEIGEVKTINTREKYIETEFKGSKLFIPFKLIEEHKRLVKNYQDNVSFIFSQSKGGDHIGFLTSDYRRFNFTNFFAFQDKKLDVLVGYLNFHTGDEKDSHLHIFIKIDETFAKNFERKHKMTISEASSELEIKSVCGKDLKIEEFIAPSFIKFLDEKASKEIENNLTSKKQTSLIPFKSTQSLSPFVKEKRQKELEKLFQEEGEEIKPTKLSTGILLIDDKFIKCSIRKRFTSGKVLVTPYHLDYRHITMNVSAKDLLTNVAYVRKLTEEYENFAENLDNEFELDSFRDNAIWEHQLRLDAIFGGISFKSFFKELENGLSDIASDSLSTVSSEKLNRMLNFINNQRLRNNTIYERSLLAIKEKKEIV